MHQSCLALLGSGCHLGIDQVHSRRQLNTGEIELR